jgi:hypothetical protein
MHTIRIWASPTSVPDAANSASIPAVAAEIGLAVIDCWDAMTEIDSGRSGRTPALREVSAITGSIRSFKL